MYTSSSIVSLALIIGSLLATICNAKCCDPPSPAFIPVDLSSRHHAGQVTQNKIIEQINKLLSGPIYDKTSVSVEVTAQAETLFSIHHTARNKSELYHGGAKTVDNRTNFRIASMTKPFTVLALFQLQEAGKLNLDDSLLVSLPGLNNTGSLPWKDLTIRSLASQNSGLPRDFAQDDWINHPDVAHQLGLPPLDPEKCGDVKCLPACDEMVNFTRTCTSNDLLAWVEQLEPVFAPDQRSSYSNINFDLLGLVIANVSGMSYDDYITEHILKPIGLTAGTSFHQPPDKHAAVARDEEYYWPFYMGVQNPTGGLYSNSADMGAWMRYVLTTFNAHAHGALNWFQPTSWSGGLRTFYGMPWEIYRLKTSELVGGDSDRALTLITKGGGLPSYYSLVTMIPEYNFGVTVLVAGNLKAVENIAEIIIVEMAKLAEKMALKNLAENYAGRYVAEGDETSAVIIRVSKDNALHVDKFMSRGKDVMAVLKEFYADGGDFELDLTPTLLYADQKAQKGEKWRVLPRKLQTGKDKKSIWNKFCISDVEIHMYGGIAVNEIIFWKDENGHVDEIELTAYRTKLKRASIKDKDIDADKDQVKSELR